MTVFHAPDIPEIYALYRHAFVDGTEGLLGDFNLDDDDDFDSVELHARDLLKDYEWMYGRHERFDRCDMVNAGMLFLAGQNPGERH